MTSCCTLLSQLCSFRNGGFSPSPTHPTATTATTMLDNDSAATTTKARVLRRRRAQAIKKASSAAPLLADISLDDLKDFPFFRPTKPFIPPQGELADPDFYKMGYGRDVRVYGVEFREGPDGYGVFASKDIEGRKRPRVIMEIPLRTMITVTQKQPWMFLPDFIPIGHPIFDIINSTDPETDWDFRLACLLLFALDGHYDLWQLYGDFLPNSNECTSLLLATEEDLLELQDPNLESVMREQQQRVLLFWEKYWHSDQPWKIKRLARNPERFLWAVGIAQTRNINYQLTLGGLNPDTNLLVPYADMLNHSFQPNCFFHWRYMDRVLEVMTNPGQHIMRGEEMTINYLRGGSTMDYIREGPNNLLMQRYGFSSPVNPWEEISIPGDSRIHLDTFLSVFNINGIPEEYHFNDEGDSFVDGAVIAAARALPTWSDGAVPAIPSVERKAAKDLQEQCLQILSSYPTTAEQDQQILDSNPNIRRTLETAVKYRLHRKYFIKKIIDSLGIYRSKLL